MKKIKFLLFLFIAAAGLTFLVNQALAATPSVNEMFGGSGSNFAETAGFSTINLVLLIARLIRAFLTVTGIIAVVFIIYAGFRWTTAGGDDTKVKKAKDILKNAVIGLVIIFSSFIVAQFVISQITGAVGGDTSIVEDDDEGDGDIPDSDTARYFYLESVNTDCASAIRNLQLQFVFSQKVNVSDITTGGNIIVSYDGGGPVAGTFAAANGKTYPTKTFTFTPSATCLIPETTTTVNCFAQPEGVTGDVAYEININSALKSYTGNDLICSTEHRCSGIDFIIPEEAGFDLTPPTISITAPSVYAYYGLPTVLQAHTLDDSGVSSVAFYSDDEDIDDSGLDEALSTTLSPENYFNGSWDTTGYATNHDYEITATGSDCGGNQATSEGKTINLRAENCYNEEPDTGLGETGTCVDTEPCDCGGSDTSSPYYCGACIGSECYRDSDCASGSCVSGVCVEDVEIDEVSPSDGAVGNLITISGIGFGSTAGTVTFLGAESTGDEKETSGYTGCTSTWSNTQVVVQVPTGTIDGPLQLTVAADLDYDRTDDDNGPVIGDIQGRFDVNETIRPGLCSIVNNDTTVTDPDSGEAKDEVTVSGINFGATRSGATFYFDSYEPQSYDDWTSTSFTTVVPSLDDGLYGVQLFTGATGSREGSNTLNFTVSSLTDAEAPIISDIDSGISRCSDDGSICSDAGDCVDPAATCNEDKDSGPPGQYVTIYGLNFGTSGTVRFRDENTDNEALADTSFPAECEDAYWQDDMIIIKVPSSYGIIGSGTIATINHKVRVIRGTTSSNEVDFEILSGEAAPGICAIDPDSGPTGTTGVKIYGERMGGDGAVVFFDSQDIDQFVYGDWTERGDDKISGIVIPEETDSGPVYIIDDADIRSNSISFTVSSCESNDDCDTGETCCESGVCDDVCADVLHDSFYTYYFSTDYIPDAPEVDQCCTSGTCASPTPWEHWDRGNEVCLDASIRAEFTKEMNATTFTTTNILLKKCLDSSCNATEAVSLATRPTVSADSFSWAPASALIAGTRYKVTIKGGTGGVASSVAAGGLEMLQDFSWEFETSDNGDSCELGSVLVSPDTWTAVAKDVPVDYSAEPMAEDYECVALSCDPYTWDFSSSQESKATIQNESGCEAEALPTAETVSPPGPVIITGEETDSGLDDTGQLYISFTDPRIEDYGPDCEEACLDATVWATFNIDMESADFTTSTISLKKCEDSACAYDELTSVGIDTFNYDSAIKTFSFSATDNLTANTYYRVILADSIRSTSGSSLSEGETNLVWDDGVNQVSWTFKTKDTTCLVDRVEVSPSSVTLYRVGDNQRFTATPYGEPDACSETGQRLNATNYIWDEWGVADSPNNDTAHALAELEESGAIKVADSLPSTCSSSCLNIGSSALTAVCGNNEIEPGEECDRGDVTDSDGCSSHCLWEGRRACSVPATETLCCGNGNTELFEECDDGNSTSGDGCSSQCLNEGASAIGSQCGDSNVAQSHGIGGEDCDFGNDNAEKNCSSNCLNLGSEPRDSYTAICGNSRVDTGEECDEGDTDNGDGCSSVCLHEGSSSVYRSVCGNNTVTCVSITDCDLGDTCNSLHQCVETGEDCDDGNRVDGDGCSAACLSEGSSDDYTGGPSICGNGTTEVGEECEATGTPEQAAFAIATIAFNAPEEVLASGDNSATATISALEQTDEMDTHLGTATLTLECSCVDDGSCDSTGISYGCGDASCCYSRPAIVTGTPSYPATGATNLCRNTAVWMAFNQIMDPVGIANGETLYLKYSKDATGNSITASTCPTSYTTDYAISNSNQNWWQKAWNWISFNVLKIFGASAATTFKACLVPVTYEMVGGGSEYKIYLDFASALEEGEYQLVALGESSGNSTDSVVEGVVGASGVGIYTGQTVTFNVGEEICTLKTVNVTDQGKTVSSVFDDASPGVFTEEREVHTLLAAAYADSLMTEELQEVSEYSWVWTWGDESGVSIIDVASADAITTSATAENTNGSETATATATITSSVGGVSSTSSISGSADLSVILCENLWPNVSPTADGYFPFEDTAAAKRYFDLDPHFTKFSFYYCRDQEGSTNLPVLDVIQTAASPISSVIKEILFLVRGTSDAIGVRVFHNDDYLSPANWYKAQGFSGAPGETTLDGYGAVVDGNTYYVSAANKEAGIIYPNIYAISWNENAGEETEKIVSQILENWSFNANTREVKDTNVCRTTGTYLYDSNSDLISCSSDYDCEGLSNDPTYCESGKTKITHDLKRLTDARLIASYLEDYGEENKHCSVTKNQGCSSEDDCPGSETCLPEVPEIQSGTFLSSFTTSTWPSWVAVLSNDLGSTLPVDPLNKFVNCPNGANEDYCWDSVAGTFTCQEGSHAYLYRSIGGEEYDLAVQLEYNGLWGIQLDDDSDDNANLYAEYASRSSPSGFYLDGQLCDGSIIGNSARCGDGVVGLDEVCEIGEYESGDKACDTDGDGIGEGNLCSTASDCDTDVGETCEDIDCGSEAGTIAVSCYEDTIKICEGGLNEGEVCVLDTDCDKEAVDDGLGDCGDSTVCAYQTVTEAMGIGGGAECIPYDCGNGVVDSGETCDDGENNGQYGYCDENCTLTDAFYCGDGFLAGDEECDCGGTTNFSSVMANTSSWAYNSSCDAANGQYDTTYDDTCAFDCSFPGPSCGDGEINGGEECDGDYEAWLGALCGAGDDYVSCETDDDCASTSCGSGGVACTQEKVCVGGLDDGHECSTNADCDKTVADDKLGDCSDFEYQLYRYRTCDDDPGKTCLWNTWSACLGGEQICGNGEVEGEEECDDGNDDSSDECTNICTLNVCGDGYKYDSYETCDEGADNGVECSPDYGDTCTYCSADCQYTTVSGAYCGDESVGGDEYCDGSDLPKYCFLGAIDPASRSYDTSVDCSGESNPDSYCVSQLGTGATCATVGICDGGSYSSYLYNGYPCESGGGSNGKTCGSSYASATMGDCVVPVCADDCGQTCPFDYDSTSIQIQTELAGASKETEADLYSYLSGSSPDTATLYLPACSVGTQILADIDMDNIEPPSIDIVFVTDLSGSMSYSISGAAGAAVGSRRIDYAVSAIQQTIDNLFDAYSGSDGEMRIALVSYTWGYNMDGDSYIDNGVDTDGDGKIEDDDNCIGDTIDGDSLAWIDQGFTERSGKYDLLYDEEIGVESYLNRTGGGTPTAAGFKCAESLLDDSSADYKIVILLSDGDPTVTMAGASSDGATADTLNEAYDAVHGSSGSLDNLEVKTYTASLTSSDDLIGYMAHFSSDTCGASSPSGSVCSISGDSCSSSSCDDVCTEPTESYGEICEDNIDCLPEGEEGVCSSDPEYTCSVVEDCPKVCSNSHHACDWPDDMLFLSCTEDIYIDADHIYYDTCGYTGVTCDIDESQGTCSSQSCTTDTDDPYKQASDCTETNFIEYAYSDYSEEGIEEMYNNIASSILDVTFGFVTTVSGSTRVTTGSVAEGDDMVLPFPEGFNCDNDSEWTIPVRLSFAGSGTVHLSDIKMSYCPTESAIATTATVVDEDLDDDGFNDDVDNCPDDPNPDQADADGDGVGAICDSNDTPGEGGAAGEVEGNDTDSDGVPDDSDNCPETSNEDQDDADGDGVGNACDNCPYASNTDQADADDDETGDACDDDNDGDDVADDVDNCPDDSNPDQADTDSDGVGDTCDNCPDIPNADQADSDSDGVGDGCETECGDGEIDDGEYCDGEVLPVYCQKLSEDPSERDVYWCGNDRSCTCDTGYIYSSGSFSGLCDGGTFLDDEGNFYEYDGMVCYDTYTDAPSGVCGEDNSTNGTVMGTCETDVCSSDCTTSVMDQWNKSTVSCGDNAVSDSEFCEPALSLSTVYCIKGGEDPGDRDVQVVDCTDAASCDCDGLGYVGYRAAESDEIGVCDSGSRIGTSWYDYTGGLCSMSSSSSEWDCGEDFSVWFIPVTTEGTCEVDTCASDCVSSTVSALDTD